MHSEFCDLLGGDTSHLRVCSLDNHEVGRLFARSGTIDPGIKSRIASYEFIYSWFGSQDEDFIANLNQLSDGDLRLFPFRPAIPVTHMVEYYASCLDIHLPVQHHADVPLTSAGIQWVDGFWLEQGFVGKRLLVVAPGSGAREKNWPSSYFKEIARWWRQKDHGQVLVLLGPAEEDQGLEALFAEDALVVKGLTLGQVVPLLARCEVYLGNDSGITHLAAVLGTRTVALFGPTDPLLWHPRGERVTLVRPRIDCSPSDLSARNGGEHQSCLTDLSAKDVMEFVDSLLE